VKTGVGEPVVECGGARGCQPKASANPGGGVGTGLADDEAALIGIVEEHLNAADTRPSIGRGGGIEGEAAHDIAAYGQKVAGRGVFNLQTYAALRERRAGCRVTRSSAEILSESCGSTTNPEELGHVDAADTSRAHGAILVSGWRRGRAWPTRGRLCPHTSTTKRQRGKQAEYANTYCLP
jgi:hypothetical protein